MPGKMRVMAVMSSLWLAGCSVFGVHRVAEPPHRVIARIGPIEIRRYEPRVAAETLVPGGEMHARSAGFRRVAGYIFGGNQTRTAIAMTAPVTQTHAAQTPVTGTHASEGTWQIRFFMPAGSTLQTLPKPNDAAVRLVQEPAQTVAALRFSGLALPGAVSRESADLLAGLRGSTWTAVGTPEAWFYDPPWTLPPLRRNEVAVIVTPATTEPP